MTSWASWQRFCVITLTVNSRKQVLHCRFLFPTMWLCQWVSHPFAQAHTSQRDELSTCPNISGKSVKPHPLSRHSYISASLTHTHTHTPSNSVISSPYFIMDPSFGHCQAIVAFSQQAPVEEAWSTARREEPELCVYSAYSQRSA